MNNIKDKIKQFSELQNAARPLTEYLNKYYHPNSQAIVTTDSVKITEDLISSPVLLL